MTRRGSARGGQGRARRRRADPFGYRVLVAECCQARRSPRTAPDRPATARSPWHRSANVQRVRRSQSTVTPFARVRHPVVSRSRPRPSRSLPALPDPGSAGLTRPGGGTGVFSLARGCPLGVIALNCERGLTEFSGRMSERGSGRALSRWRNYGRTCLFSPAGADDHGARRRGQLAVNERSSRWGPAAAGGDGSPGELANATCALCGIELSIISLVPDGGPGSAEVRWYCRDIVSCTERWTADRARRAVQVPVADANAPDPDAGSVPDEQAAPPGDTASVAAEAQAPAEEPGRPASQDRPANRGQPGSRNQTRSAPGSPAGAGPGHGLRRGPALPAPGPPGRSVVDGISPPPWDRQPYIDHGRRAFRRRRAGVSVMFSAADDPVERRVRPVADEADR